MSEKEVFTRKRETYGIIKSWFIFDPVDRETTGASYLIAVRIFDATS